jgi:hypothetical protein
MGFLSAWTRPSSAITMPHLDVLGKS